MSLLTDIELAITAAWENTPPVVTTAQREPNHVARLIGQVCQPIADSIVSNRIATAASVRAIFCHKNPYAFWQNPMASGEEAVVRRELGDLLVIVRSPFHECALILQTKMSGPKAPTPWEPGVVVPVSSTGQRDLYACLHPFHLEYEGRQDQPTALKARQAGSVAKLEAKFKEQNVPLFAYELAKVATGASPPAPPAMIFAWIDSKNAAGVRVRQSSPWSAWLTEPSQPAALSQSATLSSTLAACLDDMIRNPTPQVGRSIGTSGLYPEWHRLVRDLEDWAYSWFRGAEHTSTHDVDTVDDVYDSSLYDSQASAFMAWTTAGPYPELQKLPSLNRPWRYFQAVSRSRGNSRLRVLQGAAPPSAPTGQNGDALEGGFAIIEIRLAPPPLSVG